AASDARREERERNLRAERERQALLAVRRLEQAERNQPLASLAALAGSLAREHARTVAEAELLRRQAVDLRRKGQRRLQDPRRPPPPHPPPRGTEPRRAPAPPPPRPLRPPAPPRPARGAPRVGPPRLPRHPRPLYREARRHQGAAGPLPDLPVRPRRRPLPRQ